MATEEQEYAPGWKPEKEGETVEGKVVAVDSRLGYQDKPYPILTLEDEGGSRVALHVTGKILREEVAARLAPLAPKDRIGVFFHVTYLGQRQPADKNRQPYRVFKVRSDHDGVAYDFSRDLREEDRPLNDIPIQPDPPVMPAAEPTPQKNEDEGDLPF